MAGGIEGDDSTAKKSALFQGGPGWEVEKTDNAAKKFLRLPPIREDAKKTLLLLLLLERHSSKKDT